MTKHCVQETKTGQGDMESAKQREVEELRDKVLSLEKTVSALCLQKQSSSQSRQDSNFGGSNFNCYGCRGAGHTRRYCNLSPGGRARPDIRCQICHQNGHTADSCQLLQLVNLTDRSENGQTLRKN